MGSFSYECDAPCLIVLRHKKVERVSGGLGLLLRLTHRPTLDSGSGARVLGVEVGFQYQCTVRRYADVPVRT